MSHILGGTADNIFYEAKLHHDLSFNIIFLATLVQGEPTRLVCRVVVVHGKSTEGVALVSIENISKGYH